MKTADIIEGMQILERYRDKPGYDVGAEHDQLYVYATSRTLSDEDAQRMITLGWWQEGVARAGDDFAVGDYDSGEGWTCYV